jgi:hypothetical protein
MMFARAVPNKQPRQKTLHKKVVIMEHEPKIPYYSLREMLGTAAKPSETEVGIINETENWIHRRALDYLMVGFVTDADQVESRKEERYQDYLTTVQLDLAQYYRDVTHRNEEHMRNSIPETWDTVVDMYGVQVRRPDMPSPEVLLGSIVNLGRYAKTAPTYKEIKHVAAEGLELYYDEALKESCLLMNKRLHEIAGELPTAPHEVAEGEDLMTYDELMAEQKAINSRLNAAERIYLERHPQDAVDNIVPLDLPSRSEVSLHTGPTYVVQQLGKAGTALVRTDKV